MNSLEFYDDNNIFPRFNLPSHKEIYYASVEDSITFDSNVIKLFNELSEDQIFITKPTSDKNDFNIVELTNQTKNENYYGLHLLGTSVKKGLHKNDKNNTLLNLLKKVYETGKTEIIKAKLYEDNFNTKILEFQMFKYDSLVIVLIKNITESIFSKKQDELINYTSQFIVQNSRIVKASKSFLDLLNIDLNHNFCYWSKSKIQVLNGSKQEQWLEIYEKVINQKVTHAEKMCIKLDNRIYWLNICVNFVLFHKKSAVLVTFDNVTNQKEMIRELDKNRWETRQLRHQLSELQLISKTAISYKVLDKPIMWTPESYNILELDLYGEYHGDLSEFIIEEESHLSIEKHIKNVSMDNNYITYKLCILTPKHNKKYLSVHTFFKFNEYGEQVGYTSFYNDINLSI